MRLPSPLALIVALACTSGAAAFLVHVPAHADEPRQAAPAPAPVAATAAEDDDMRSTARKRVEKETAEWVEQILEEDRKRRAAAAAR